MAKQIFTDVFLKPYLENFRLSAMPDIQDKRRILQNWHESISNRKFTKEEEAKSRFVNEIFGDVLGFNYKNSTKWQIKEENKSVVGSTKPDAALGQFKVVENGVDHDVHIVVEVKGQKISLDKPQNRKTLQITPVDQAFLYASKAGGNCKWVVVTNFSEIRFYHYSGQEAYQGYTIEGLQDELQLKQFLFLFHKDRLTNEIKASTEKLFELRDAASKNGRRDMHIIDELYYTLQGFDGLGFIDPNYLCNIKPFNLMEERVWHFENGGFLTLNQEIAILMQGFTIQDDRPVFSAPYAKLLKQAKVHEAVDKMTFILKRLSACAVTSIYFFKDNKDKLNAMGRSGNLRNIRYINKDLLLSIDPGLTKSEDCQCLNCIFRTLNFKTLIRKLKDAEKQTNMEPLEEAYGHYLVATDNFTKAYFLYKKSELTLGATSNKVGYFIAKINQLKLPHLIKSYSGEVDQSIIADVKSIDLDRSLYQELDFYVADDVRKYLIEIKENRLFLRLKESINQIAGKVERNVHGNWDLNTLHWNYCLLHFYFHKNYFVYDIFSEYKDLVAAIFRAFVNSYSQPDQKLAEFPEFYLTEAAIYVDSREFKKIIELTGDLKVQDGKEREIADKAIDFLQSQNRPGIMGHYLKENDLAAQLINPHFQDTYTRIFSNLFTLLSKLAFSPDALPLGLAQPIIGLIQTEDFLAWFDLAELGKFIERYGNIFRDFELLDILKHAIRNNPYGTHKYDDLIGSVSAAHRKFYPESKIHDIGLMRTAIANATDHKGKCNPWSLLPLLAIFDEEGRAILMKEIVASLNDEFNDFMYLKMLGNGIVQWDESELFDLYIAEVNCHKGKGMVLKNGEPTFDNYAMINLINQVYFHDIPFSTPALKQLTNLSDFERWALNPFQFDYNIFRPEWLMAVDNESVLKRLAKVEQIGLSLYEFLKGGYQQQLAEIYFRYFASSETTSLVD